MNNIKSIPEKIDIRTDHYFPLQLIALGAGLVLGFFLLIQQSNYLLAPIFLFFGIIFITTNHRLQINRKENTFREYVWFIGFKIGKTKPFPPPKIIVINPTNQEIGFGNLDVNRMHSTQRRAKGYLKFNEHESIYLGESTNAKRLLKRLERIIQALGISVSNNTNS